MRGIEWALLRRLINRNLEPWRVLRYYRSKEGFKNTMSICDFTLPRRTGVLSTAEGAERDWYRDSYVCNTGWLEGSIPLDDNPWVWDDVEKKWEVWPIQGARTTLQVLLKHSVVKPTPEVKEFIRTGHWSNL